MGSGVHHRHAEGNEYGVMSMPAIAVNEKVVSQGRVKPGDVENLLRKLGF